jgi:hypothetical protein
MQRRSLWAITGVLTAFVIVTVASLVSPIGKSPEARGRVYKGKSNQKMAVGRSGKFGDASAKLGGPLAAAEEDYALRAYPAMEIPIALTENAQIAFEEVRSRNVGGNRKPGRWSLVGPSNARYPGLLNFSGEDYVTSGRITSLAISPVCDAEGCFIWVGAAGGGVWRGTLGLAAKPQWHFQSASFATNAIGTITQDPNDARGKTLYVGTGEPNASGDSEAGMGIYKSADGGESWTRLPTNVFDGRSISRIVIHPTNPNIIYVGSARGVRGVSSVSGGGTSNPPVAAPFGLYRSIDGGLTFAMIWDGNASVRGVIDVELDPSDPDTVYASAFQQGIWRSSVRLDGDATFRRVFQTLSTGLNTSRTMFAVTTWNGHTRIYAGDGAQGRLSNTPGLAEESQLWRVDDADVPAAALLASQGAPGGWEKKTSSDMTNPYFATFDYCTGQCWYDSDVFTPKGYPNIVYLIGSYQYNEYARVSNSRGILLSDDAGENFTDVSWDGGDLPTTGIHPDHHEVVVNPNNPYQFFSGTDGGIVRSSGRFKDVSGSCASRGLTATQLIACQRLLSRVPTSLTSLNAGLSTLQFQSLSVSPSNANHLMGGTQDNGTFETRGSAVTWPQIIYGDGGQSGYSSGNSALRFNTFTGQANDVNFRDGDPNFWVVATGPIVASPESALFYPPIIADPNPAAAKTIFQGSQSVWRTQNWGGDQAFLEANCPEFTTSSANPACGDFVRIGGAPGSTDLTRAALGDRAGGNVGAIERTTADTGTLWVATTTGRLFISKNADAAAASVVFTRLDSLTATDPGRFISSIHVDKDNPNRAWVSYSGYNFNTPATPGHVFLVTWDPTAGSATWTNLDGGTGPMGDLPVTDLVADQVRGDLYAATDFGVLRLANGSSAWEAAGAGLPNVEVAGLTIVPNARRLYAATHGRSAWMLVLP